jgi:hypothetical protein
VRPSCQPDQGASRAVLLSLGVTSLILARAAGTNIGRVLTRNILIGSTAMLLSLAEGLPLADGDRRPADMLAA